MSSSTASNDARRTLVIDSVSRACSVALIENGEVIAADYREIGRGHAEHLVPMIEALPDRGRANRIAVDVGPGSFTGVRIGLSVARALASAWQAELVGYEALALVAVAAMAKRDDADRAAVILPGGHGEYLAGTYGIGGRVLTSAASLPPENLQAFLSEPLVAGDGFEKLTVVSQATLSQLPDARAFPLLDPATLCAAEARYARPPDAKLPGGVQP